MSKNILIQIRNFLDNLFRRPSPLEIATFKTPYPEYKEGESPLSVATFSKSKKINRR